jgi:hypothetical protein
MNTELLIYLAIHGTATVGSLVAFMVRNEHRITRIETKLENLEKSHNMLTDHGTIGHAT